MSSRRPDLLAGTPATIGLTGSRLRALQERWEARVRSTMFRLSPPYKSVVGTAAAWRLRHLHGLADFVARRPATAIPPDYDDLWFLYRQVNRRRPRCILEFGSGCSTVVLAQALKETNAFSGSARLHSIDADRSWAASTASLLPLALREVCEVRHCPAHAVTRHGVPAWQHVGLPDVVPDFLYLDGPALTRERQVAVDVLDLEARLAPGFFMVIDGRYANMRFLRMHLRRQYRFACNQLAKRSTFELIA